jgi:diguanylate cyclase (GGDEF)-like protein
VRVSLELRTAAALAAVIALLAAAVWLVCGRAHGLEIAGLSAGAFLLIAATLLGLVFHPLDVTLRRSRQLLGGRDGPSPGRTSDQVAEVDELLTSLIQVFQMGEAAMAAESWRDLARLRTHNRQLVEVGDIGQAVNAALPYRETVERALARVKAFLHADFVALLVRDQATGKLDLEGTLGVSQRSLDTSCCSELEDCPIRRAMAGDSVVRSSGHRCTLLPHTMTHQLGLPISPDARGDMALLATGTTSENFDAISDEALHALRGHLFSALQNARKYDSIRRQVVTDHLTHLYNRRYFMNRAAEEVQRSLHDQAPMSLVLVDIDHFKRFNDTYGHPTGDRVLQAVAAILQDAVRTTDVCARHGGEEFTLLLPNTPGDNAMFMANRVRNTLGQTRYTGLGLPADACITISAGVATCPRDATTIEDLLEMADRALYRAKEDGRDRVVQYEPQSAQRSAATAG